MPKATYPGIFTLFRCQTKRATPWQAIRKQLEKHFLCDRACLAYKLQRMATTTETVAYQVAGTSKDEATSGLSAIIELELDEEKGNVETTEDGNQEESSNSETFLLLRGTVRQWFDGSNLFLGKNLSAWIALAAHVACLLFVISTLLTINTRNLTYKTNYNKVVSVVAELYDDSSDNGQAKNPRGGKAESLLATTTSSRTNPTPPQYHQELTLSEREKYLVDRYDHDIDYLRRPKVTPSGWWPNEAWIQTCVDKYTTQANALLTPFSTLDDWVGYRLGDCLKLCSGCPTDNSIAGQYYYLACDPAGPQYHRRGGNETAIDQILDRFASIEGFVAAPNDALLVHLRLGDKIDDSTSSVVDMLQNSADPGHKSFQELHAIKSLYEFLTNIVTSGSRKVEIRGGSQIPQKYVKSKTYAYCLRDAVEEAGYDVTINLDEGNPDKDFFYMVSARKIIVTVGGFSRFVGHLVLQKGGIVYGRMFR